jgi:GDP-mannose pyrophosphatase NudK
MCMISRWYGCLDLVGQQIQDLFIEPGCVLTNMQVLLRVRLKAGDKFAVLEHAVLATFAIMVRMLANLEMVYLLIQADRYQVFIHCLLFAKEQLFRRRFVYRNMATINIIKRETIAGTKYPLQTITFQKPDLEGEIHEQENEVYFRPDAVAVLLADPKAKKFLLTRQFRLPAFLNGSDKGYLLETCAGLIDEGESAEVAARREVQEETGYPVSSLEKIGAVYTSAGGITEYVHLFVAGYDSKGAHEKGGGKAGEGEAIEVLELDFEDARERAGSGAIRDAKTMLLLQHYFLNA